MSVNSLYTFLLIVAYPRTIYKLPVIISNQNYYTLVKKKSYFIVFQYLRLDKFSKLS